MWLRLEHYVETKDMEVIFNKIRKLRNTNKKNSLFYIIFTVRLPLALVLLSHIILDKEDPLEHPSIPQFSFKM